MKQKKLENLCINTIRSLSIDAIEKANSGHPGAPLGLAPTAFVLWTKFLKHNPKNSDWLNRDRFILSGGHASILLYSLLYLTGYGLTLEDIKNFRQMKSKTPGHPEYGHTNGVETTTGPLGQGFANAVGFAMAEAHLATRFNKKDKKIIDHNTYVMCGDGDLMEGISTEAASLAGHFSLSKLICLYDSNDISIEGNTNITFTEDVSKKFEALGWLVIKVKDGNDTKEIENAIKKAKKNKTKPKLILIKTLIGFGSPKEGSADAHGSPLNKEEIKKTKKALGLNPNKTFFVPKEVVAEFKKEISKGKTKETKWQKLFIEYSKKYPALSKEISNIVNESLPKKWDKNISNFSKENKIATRASSGKVLNSIAKNISSLIGGSADLAPSNKTYLENFGEFQKNKYAEKNIRFGVREHAMGAIMAGLYLHSKLRVFGGTFLVFSDYLRPAIRIASLMKLPLIYVFTHDSIAVGEDGPTHQPIEHIASLRLIPNLNVIRPADAFETIEAWKVAIKSKKNPIALILSRQKLPILHNNKKEIKNNFEKGAYILEETKGKPDIILIATGSEVHLAIEVKKELEKKKIKVRIISMPSVELFEKTTQNYKDKILPKKVTKRISIEAGTTKGWEKYVGDNGITIGIDTFGTSAPGDEILKSYGFSKESIVKKSLALLK